ncbi:hypothetical protein [Actinospica robiniae]|uniref:hypothetical protein n=1 Tax=Actinospica robiniae TaxID=304901 RepID=UPI000413D745|nr:hypothetical protein [Actinospica robiniae]
MLYKRSAAAVAAFAAAVVSPVLTAASASAIYIPWTEQTVFAIGPTGDHVAEWMGLSQGWTIIGGPASEVYAGSAGVFDTNPTTGDIYEYNGTPGSWTQISQIDYDGDGLYAMAESTTGLYGVTLDESDSGSASTDVELYSGNGSVWTVIGGPANPNLAAGG